MSERCFGVVFSSVVGSGEWYCCLHAELEEVVSTVLRAVFSTSHRCVLFFEERG